MNPDIKARWVQALRSGKYRQISGKLAREAASDEAAYCCLGVLCEIAVEDGVVSRTGHRSGAIEYGNGTDSDGQVAHLPMSVMRWAGLSEQNPSVHDGRFTLAGLNDNGTSFAHIAGVIEEQL